jgi:hypothetical protein
VTGPHCVQGPVRHPAAAPELPVEDREQANQERKRSRFLPPPRRGRNRLLPKRNYLACGFSPCSTPSRVEDKALKGTATLCSRPFRCAAFRSLSRTASAVSAVHSETESQFRATPAVAGADLEQVQQLGFGQVVLRGMTAWGGRRCPQRSWRPCRLQTPRSAQTAPPVGGSPRRRRVQRAVSARCCRGPVECRCRFPNSARGARPSSPWVSPNRG